MSRARLLVVTLLLVNALAACSQGVESAGEASPSVAASSAPAASPAPTESDVPTAESIAPAPSANKEDALKAAVAEYTDAYFAGDYGIAVEKLWSARCVGDNDERNTMLGILAAQKFNYPEGTPRPVAENLTIDRIDGDIAVVTYDYASEAERGTISSQPWVLEEGQWKFDAC